MLDYQIILHTLANDISKTQSTINEWTCFTHHKTIVQMNLHHSAFDSLLLCLLGEVALLLLGNTVLALRVGHLATEVALLLGHCLLLLLDNRLRPDGSMDLLIHFTETISVDASLDVACELLLVLARILLLEKTAMPPHGNS